MIIDVTVRLPNDIYLFTGVEPTNVWTWNDDEPVEWRNDGDLMLLND